MTPEHKERGPVPFPPPVVYGTGLLLGWIGEGAAATPDLPRTLAWIAGALGLAAFIALSVRSVALFSSRGTGVLPSQPVRAFVTDGAYRFTRNPMYLGMTLFYLGWALASGWLWAVALLPIVIAFVDRVIIRSEEAHLEAKFGTAYKEYRTSVRRWV